MNFFPPWMLAFPVTLIPRQDSKPYIKKQGGGNPASECFQTRRTETTEWLIKDCVSAVCSLQPPDLRTCTAENNTRHLIPSAGVCLLLNIRRYPPRVAAGPKQSGGSETRPSAMSSGKQHFVSHFWTAAEPWDPLGFEQDIFLAPNSSNLIGDHWSMSDRVPHLTVCGLSLIDCFSLWLCAMHSACSIYSYCLSSASTFKANIWKLKNWNTSHDICTQNKCLTVKKKNTEKSNTTLRLMNAARQAGWVCCSTSAGMFLHFRELGRWLTKPAATTTVKLFVLMLT